MKQTIKLNESQLRSLVRESIAGLLQEGPGAGYYVSFSGLHGTNVHITGRGKNERGEIIINFKAQVAPSLVEWKAEDYYDAVSSEGIYYDNDLVQEYGDEEKTVNGGTINGYVYQSDVEDYVGSGEQLTLQQVVEFINDKLDGFSFKTLVGSGYVHSDLSDPMNFENIEVIVSDPYYGSETVYIRTLELQAPAISEAINWFFANCYRFDEIFGEQGEDVYDNQEGENDMAQQQVINENMLRQIIRESLKQIVKENVIKSRQSMGEGSNVYYGEDEMSFFAADYKANVFRRLPTLAKAKACAQELYQAEQARERKRIDMFRRNAGPAMQGKF